VDFTNRSKHHGTIVRRGGIGNDLRSREGRDDRSALPRSDSADGEGEGEILADGLTIFGDEGDPVCVWIDSEADSAPIGDNGVTKLTEIRGDRLGLVGEVAIGLGVDEDRLDAKLGHEFGQKHAASSITRVDGDLEAGAANTIRVDVAENSAKIRFVDLRPTDGSDLADRICGVLAEFT
jgi:hypothetical protein